MSLTPIVPDNQIVRDITKIPVSEMTPEEKRLFTQNNYLKMEGTKLVDGKVITKDGFNMTDASIDEKMAYMAGMMDDLN